jgi:hypothetical protein
MMSALISLDMALVRPTSVASQYISDENGTEVTMVQRGPTYVMSNASLLRVFALYSEHGPPTDLADRMNAAMSVPLALAMSPGLVKANADADKCDPTSKHAPLLIWLCRDLLDGLQRRGFRTYDGPQGTGAYGLIQLRGGGYYINTGASELIIDGKIKIKSDAPIDHFDKQGLVFADGSKISADVVVWACGYGQPGPGIQRLMAPKDAEGLRPVWKLDDEGELGCICRDSGVKGLYVMMGSSFSLSLALFQKAYITRDQGILRLDATTLGTSLCVRDISLARYRKLIICYRHQGH